MGSEEFRLSMSGPTASFFLYEAANRPCDFEGLLFGDYQRCLHREISDRDDADDQNRPATIIHDVSIRRIVPTGVKFSFYDRRFKANMPDYAADVVKCIDAHTKTTAATGGPLSSSQATASSESGQKSGVDESIVRSGFLGWFRYQKCPPRHTMSELAVCRALSTSEALRQFPVLNNQPNGSGDGDDLSSYYPWPGNGPFYLFAYPGNKIEILEWNIQLTAFNTETRQLRSIRMNIRNLGDTTHTDYWKLGASGSAATAGVDHLLPGVVSDDFTNELVAQTDRMVEKAKEQLAQAYEKVVDNSLKMVKKWHQQQQKMSAHLSAKPSSYYVKYGYAPSLSEEIKALLDNLHTSIGSKRNQADDMTEEANEDNRPNLSQRSEYDLFTTVCHVQDTPNTIHEDDWETNIDKELDNLGMEENEDGVLVGRGSDIHVNANRRNKRPKENTSSSSSGANSDELPESASSISKEATDVVKKELNFTSSVSASATFPAPKSNFGIHSGQAQGNTMTSGGSSKLQPQQQRKKSKSSDSGGSGESSGDHPTVTTTTPSNAQFITSTPSSISQRGSIREQTPTSSTPSAGGSAASPVSISVGTGRGMNIGKGRGSRLPDVGPPPGFSPTGNK